MAAMRQASRLAEGERSEGVGRVVQARYLHARGVEHGLAAPRDSQSPLPRRATVKSASRRSVENVDDARRGARGRAARAVGAWPRRRDRRRSAPRVAACAKIRALACAYSSMRGVAVHVVRGHVEHHGRRQLERGGGLELKARQLEHVEIRNRLIEQVERGPAEVAARERRAVRRAPAMRATRLVTVLLPLVPVTPMTGACAARAKSSMSPSTSMPRARASVAIGSSSDTPGDINTCVAPSSSDRSNAPRRISMALGESCRALRDPAAPRACRSPPRRCRASRDSAGTKRPSCRDRLPRLLIIVSSRWRGRSAPAGS